ncbi:hypothetical protein LAZ67_23000950 [Cordylochernes scorpioides]|uniref:Uncharacterized protein n=1 Tax=Cordylochernes scorpioides TaxID=51811 RepID=A0ABY6LQG6_9ARAC|nr:hypothetical protein LAZ67_23000950 [Cordylochernes scorpioides]
MEKSKHIALNDPLLRLGVVLIVIFTWVVYRGVHLELVTSFSLIAFLQTFRRFIAQEADQ